MNTWGRLSILSLVLVATLGSADAQNGSPSLIPAGEFTVNIKPFSAVITDTSNIDNNMVIVKLVEPTGTKSDITLNLYRLNGGISENQKNATVNDFPNVGPGSTPLKLPFDSTQPSIYKTINGDATNDSIAEYVSIADHALPPWAYFRKVRFSQYNIPNEAAPAPHACTGGPAPAWIVSATATGKGSNGKMTYKCSFQQITLNSQFIQQAWINGTGISVAHGILKNAFALNLGDYGKKEECVNQYPANAIGSGPYDGNTFVVTQPPITGSCGTTLIDQVSAAMPSVPLSGVIPLACFYRVNMDTGNYATLSTRRRADTCPDCNDPNKNPGADGHIDSFTSGESCKGRDFDDLPGSPYYTSNVTN